MSLINDLKKIWDLLHPSISTKRAVVAGLIVGGVLLSWAILPAVVVGCVVYGFSSLKEFFSPSKSDFANNNLTPTASASNIPMIAVTPAPEASATATQARIKVVKPIRRNNLFGLFGTSPPPSNSQLAPSVLKRTVSVPTLSR